MIPKKEYKGHLLPYDLYYLVISYANISKWYITNNLVITENNKPPREIEYLTKKELYTLIQQAIKYNVDNIIYEEDITLNDINEL